METINNIIEVTVLVAAGAAVVGVLLLTSKAGQILQETDSRVQRNTKK